MVPSVDEVQSRARHNLVLEFVKFVNARFVAVAVENQLRPVDVLAREAGIRERYEDEHARLVRRVHLRPLAEILVEKRTHQELVIAVWRDEHIECSSRTLAREVRFDFSRDVHAIRVCWSERHSSVYTPGCCTSGLCRRSSIPCRRCSGSPTAARAVACPPSARQGLPRAGSASVHKPAVFLSSPWWTSGCAVDSLH